MILEVIVRHYRRRTLGIVLAFGILMVGLVAAPASYAATPASGTGTLTTTHTTITYNGVHFTTPNASGQRPTPATTSRYR